MDTTKKYHIRAKKSLWQNFLVDKTILSKIVSATEINGKNIIEVWPWYWALTDYIVWRKPLSLLLLELDTDMIDILYDRIENWELEMDTHIDIVNIDVYPSAGFSLDVTKGCAPLTINFESKSTDNASNISWILEGAEQEQVEGLNPSVTYNLPGIYDIKVIANNEFGSDTISLNQVIEVIETPEITFEYEIEELRVNFSANVEEFDELFWDFDDGWTSDDLNAEHIYEREGTYLVTLTSILGNCVSTHQEEIIFLSSSSDEIDAEVNVAIYPNPASNLVNIDFENLDEVESIIILDQLGRNVWSKEVRYGEKKMSISEISNFIPGQYLIGIILNGKKPVFRKLLIVR